MDRRPGIPPTDWWPRRAALVVAAGVAALTPGRNRALSRQATPGPSGVPSGSLFVQAFSAGTLEPVTGAVGGFQLTLREGVSRTLYFPDRSGRQVGVVPTEAALAALDLSNDDPPNAALVAERAGDDVPMSEVAWVVELQSGMYDAIDETLVYELRFLTTEGSAPGFAFVPDAAPTGPMRLVAGHLFIDKAGRSPDLGPKIIESQEVLP